MRWRAEKISILSLEQYLNDIDAEGYEATHFVPPRNIIVVSREKEVVELTEEPVEVKKKRSFLGWLQKNKG